MKTLKQFEKQDLGFDDFLKPLDRIDEEFYFHIACGYVASNYDDAKFSQNGECSRQDEHTGVRFYSTVGKFGDKFYYLGDMPSFNPDEYRREIERELKP